MKCNTKCDIYTIIREPLHFSCMANYVCGTWKVNRQRFTSKSTGKKHEKLFSTAISQVFGLFDNLKDLKMRWEWIIFLR